MFLKFYRFDWVSLRDFKKKLYRYEKRKCSTQTVIVKSSWNSFVHEIYRRAFVFTKDDLVCSLNVVSMFGFWEFCAVKLCDPITCLRLIGFLFTLFSFSGVYVMKSTSIHHWILSTEGQLRWKDEQSQWTVGFWVENRAQVKTHWSPDIKRQLFNMASDDFQ